MNGYYSPATTAAWPPVPPQPACWQVALRSLHVLGGAAGAGVKMLDPARLLLRAGGLAISDLPGDRAEQLLVQIGQGVSPGPLIQAVPAIGRVLDRSALWDDGV